MDNNFHRETAAAASAQRAVNFLVVIISVSYLSSSQIIIIRPILCGLLLVLDPIQYRHNQFIIMSPKVSVRLE